jgi:hypothetical protein
MFRLVNLVWIALLAAAIAGTFAVKEEVRHDEAALAAVKRSIAEEKDAIRMLTATWSFVNQPEVLRRAMAGDRADLAPIAARHVMTLDRLADRIARDRRLAETTQEALAIREDIAAFERRARQP